MEIIITKTPMFKDHRKLWEKYRTKPVHLFTILEDFGLDAALHCVPLSYDNALLAFDFVDRLSELVAYIPQAEKLLQLIESTADGFTTKQKLVQARAALMKIAHHIPGLEHRTAAKAIILASKIPPNVAEVAEKAASAKRYEAAKKAGPNDPVSITTGEKAYQAEREAQKEIFKAFFS